MNYYTDANFRRDVARVVGGVASSGGGTDLTTVNNRLSSLEGNRVTFKTTSQIGLDPSGVEDIAPKINAAIIAAGKSPLYLVCDQIPAVYSHSGTIYDQGNGIIWPGVGYATPDLSNAAGGYPTISPIRIKVADNNLDGWRIAGRGSVIGPFHWDFTGVVNNRTTKKYRIWGYAKNSARNNEVSGYWEGPIPKTEYHVNGPRITFRGVVHGGTTAGKAITNGEGFYYAPALNNGGGDDQQDCVFDIQAQNLNGWVGYAEPGSSCGSHDLSRVKSYRCKSGFNFTIGGDHTAPYLEQTGYGYDDEVSAGTAGIPWYNSDGQAFLVQRGTIEDGDKFTVAKYITPFLNGKRNILAVIKRNVGMMFLALPTYMLEVLGESLAGGLRVFMPASYRISVQASGNVSQYMRDTHANAANGARLYREFDAAGFALNTSPFWWRQYTRTAVNDVNTASIPAGGVVEFQFNTPNYIPGDWIVSRIDSYPPPDISIIFFDAFAEDHTTKVNGKQTIRITNRGSAELPSLGVRVISHYVRVTTV